MFKKYWLSIILTIVILFSSLVPFSCTHQAHQGKNDVTSSEQDQIKESAQIKENIYVDSYAECVEFILKWQSGDLDLSLKRPDGLVIEAEAAKNDPNSFINMSDGSLIKYEEEDFQKSYWVFKPMVGEWEVIIDAANVMGEKDYSLEAMVSSKEVSFSVNTNKLQYTYSDKILITAQVTAEYYNIAGAEVTGTVERPDGSTLNIILFDDGQGSHGDGFVDDGIYSNYFSEYTGEGTYTFKITVYNKEGVPALDYISEASDTEWTPEPIDRFTRIATVSVYVSYYKIAPLKHSIAFAPNRGGYFKICIMDSNGDNLVQLTKDNFDDTEPFWSPDGKKIAFASTRDGDLEIYTMDSNGDNQVQLTNNDSWDTYPSWSPDCKKIAFVSDRDGNFEIYIMDSNGDNQVQLTNNDSDSISDVPYLGWSPDSKKIAFASNCGGDQEIYTMDSNGDNQVQLTSNDLWDCYPSWSPDGKKIAFASGTVGAYGLYTMDYDGKDLFQLTDNCFIGAIASWSPDGKKIAYCASPQQNLDNKEIYVVNTDGSNIIQLTDNGSDNRNPSWSPDGKKIAFVSNKDGVFNIYIMDPDGEKQIQLTDNINFYYGYPVWSPN